MTETQTTLKASELRIGNFVTGFDKWGSYGQILSIWDNQSRTDIKYNRPDHLIQRGYCGALIEDLEPIPLTPEILENAGFEKKKSYGDEIYVNKYRALEVTMSDFGNEKYWTTFQCSDFYPSLQYLHQLQNLYFALTGEELEINL